jgi:hypothetical protein
MHIRGTILFLGFAVPACAAGQPARDTPLTQSDSTAPPAARGGFDTALAPAGPCPGRMPVVRGDSGRSDPMPTVRPDSGASPRMPVVRPCSPRDSVQRPGP